MSITRYSAVLCGILLVSFQLLFASSPSSAKAAASCATETPTSITATNGLVAFTLSKTKGSITSLQRNGKELLGGGGSIYWDMNDSVAAGGLFFAWQY